MKSRPEAPHEELASPKEPASGAPMVHVPPSDVGRSERELVVTSSVEDDCLTKDGTSTGTPGVNANEGDVSDNPSSWEDIAALMKKVPCFTAPEPPASSVDAFFYYCHHQYVELPGGLSDVVHPSHGTPEFVLRCTHPMQKYTTEEMVEVVRFTASLHKLAKRLALTHVLTLF